MRSKPLVPFLTVLLLLVSSCGVSRSDNLADAATLVFPDGTTGSIAADEVESIADQLAQNDAAVALLFNEIPPSDVILSTLIQIRLLDATIADLGTEIPADAYDAEVETINEILRGQFDDEQFELVRTGTSEYLDMVIDQRIRQATVTNAFLTGLGIDVPCTRHILLATEEEASDAVERLTAGEDFADLAAELSIGPTGPNGGDLGCSDPTGYVAEFRDAIVDAPVGEVIGPVQTQFGFHVIEVYDTDTIPEDSSLAEQEGFAYYTDFRDGVEVTVAPAYGVWDDAAGQVVVEAPR